MTKDPCFDKAVRPVRYPTRRWPLLLVAGCLVLAGCARSDASDASAGSTKPPERVSVVGSSTMAPLMGELAKAYEKSHSDIRVDVQTGGSSRGVLDVRSGMADVGMVSRALTPDESDLERVLVARDGIGMIVHADNPVRALTRDQVIGIYRGAIDNWSELGGPDMEITVVSKAEGRSTLEIFSDHFDIPYRDIAADVIIGDNQQGIQTVARAPQAIGYVSIGSAEYEARQGAGIRLVAVDGKEPTTAAVAAGNYPMTRELNLVFKSPTGDGAQGLLEFARSRDAHALIESQYFIPVAQ